MNRNVQHVLSYIAAELGTEAVLGQENQLIIKGKYPQKNIEKLY